jgi:hypothetical protein
MGRYRTGDRDDECRAFILGLLEEGARRSNEIHDLTEKKFGPEYAFLDGPRELLGERVVTGLGSSGRRRGREKYWMLAEDVTKTRTIKRFADDN